MPTNVIDITTGEPQTPKPKLYDQEEAPEKSKSRFTPKRLLAIGAGVLSLMGLNAMADMRTHNVIKGQNTSELVQPSVRLYTPKEVAKIRNFEVITAKPGDGADAIGERVNPQSYTGSESSTQERYALKSTIEPQAKNGVIQIGQNIAVPIIPGRQDVETPPQP